MKYTLLLSFLCIALFSNAQTDKSDELYFRIGVLGNYYFCKRQDEEFRTFSDGSTETLKNTTSLTNGGLGLYSTFGYAFGNGVRVGAEARGYIYKDDSYFIGLFGMTSFGGVLEYEASEALTLYTKLNWNFDYAYRDYSNRSAYSIGAGGYISIPDYPFAAVRINLEYLVTGGSISTYYDYDDTAGGVQLTQVEASYNHRGVLAELGISVGF